MTPLESLHWFVRMMDKINPSVQPMSAFDDAIYGPFGWSSFYLNFSPFDHVFYFVFEDITIFYRVANDHMIWTILRIICLVNFSRTFYIYKGNGFYSHQLIKYPLNIIIIIEGILLFFPFLMSESLAFVSLLSFAIFVEISAIGWLWACFDKGSRRLPFLVGILISSSWVV